MDSYTRSDARESGGGRRFAPRPRGHRQAPRGPGRHRASSRCARTSTRCSPRSRPDPPDVVLTDIRMPPTGTDEGIRAATPAARDAPRRSASSCCRQYAEPAYALALLDGGSEGRAYLLKERVSRRRRSSLARHPRGRRAAARWSTRRSSRCWSAPGAAARDVAARPPHPARARGARRDRPGQEQRGRRRRAGACRNGRSRSTSTRSSRSSALTEEPEVHRRVKAVLLYLSERRARGASTTPGAGGRHPGRAADRRWRP